MLLSEQMIYLDDVFIYSLTWEKHVECITALFDPLVWENLTINMAKCEFAKGTLLQRVLQNLFNSSRPFY